jgi:hypothetical protein
MELTPGMRYVGKLGPHVYYFHDGTLVSRPYYKPVQPGTPAQQTIWNKFRAGVTAWQALAPEVKEAWQTIADDFNYEGFNRFMSVWLKS